MSKWPFTRIIPCHLANDLKATGKDFRRAFEFLEEPPSKTTSSSTLFSTLFPSKRLPKPLPEDLALLDLASGILTKQGVVKPEAPLVRRGRK